MAEIVKKSKKALLESRPPDDEGELSDWARQAVDDAKTKPRSAYIRYR